MRSTDISTLHGLSAATGQSLPEDPYQTVEDREMTAYMQAMSHQHELGDVEFDAELQAMRGEL